MKPSEQLDDDAMVALVAAGPLRTPQEVADFLDATPEERALIIDNARLQGLAPTVSSWDKFVSGLAVVMQVAGVVTGISGAITGAYSVRAIL